MTFDQVFDALFAISVMVLVISVIMHVSGLIE